MTQEFEKRKFAKKSEHYRKTFAHSVTKIEDPWFLVHHAPLFAGSENLARYLCLYEIYKMTLGTAGHIAEIGSWMGTSLLYFAKLTQMFEPNAYTTIHGFEWFEGMKPNEKISRISAGTYSADYDELKSLISAQGLQDIAHIHKMDVSKELAGFVDEHPSLRFKIVFVDCSIYEVAAEAVRHLWPRLEVGGILLLDDYNHASVPEETIAINELLPDETVKTFPWSRQPSGYIVKT
jgi:hypothetical protein